VPIVKKSLVDSFVNKHVSQTGLQLSVEKVSGLFPILFTLESVNLAQDNHSILAVDSIKIGWNPLELLKRGFVLDTLSFSGIVLTQVPDFQKIKIKSSKESFFIDHLYLSDIRHPGGKIAFSLAGKLSIDEDKLKLQLDSEGGKYFSTLVALDLAAPFPIGQGSLEISDLSLLYPKGQGKGSLQVDLHRNEKVHFQGNFKDLATGNSHLKGLSISGEMDLKSGLSSKIQLNDLTYKAFQLDSVVLDISGLINDLSYQISGKQAAQFSFVSEGKLRLSPEIDFHINKLEGKILEEKFLLLKPIQLQYSGKNIRMMEASLQGIGGQVIVKDLVVADQLQGTIRANNFPVKSLRIINPRLDLEGMLSLTAILSGTQRDPSLEYTLKGDKIQWNGMGDYKIKAGPIDISVKGSTTLETLKWNLESAVPNLRLSSVGEMIYDGQKLQSVSLKAKGNIGFFSVFIPNADRLSGDIDLNLSMSGPLRSPLIKGRIVGGKVYYENALYGTTFNRGEVTVEVFDQILRLQHLSATDLTKGKIVGQGTISFKEFFNPQIFLQLDLTQFVVAQMDVFSARADGHLSMKGLLRDLKIEGDVTLTSSEVHLEETSPDIPVIRLKENGKDKYNHRHHNQKQESNILPMAIGVTIPGRMYLRGYGIDSQWKGKLTVVGPISTPELRGELLLIRGKMDIFGKPMKMIEGKITYDDFAKNDPYLSLRMMRESADITSYLTIEERGSNPKVTFSSVPALPQEEILAQLLFGRGLGKMSISQSLQLANAINAINGHKSLNFIDKIRNVFGLDVIEIKENVSASTPSTADAISPGHSLSLGKQLSDKIYISVDQSVSGDSQTSATLQADITSNLRAEINLGGDRSSGGGITWVKKY
jgi:autotransporter translocation and assembly factor TamB